jgi:Zn finger protein HypA/HybF involved in hydrogenase expression
MKSNCRHCGKEIRYMPSQSKGLYCSWNCSAADRIKTKFDLDTTWSKGMGIHLKKLRGERCEECGITEHNGKPITFQVDHINGDRRDNRHENLKIMCPNCHSQTSTFGIKNISEDGYNRMIEGGINGSKLALLKRNKN